MDNHAAIQPIPFFEAWIMLTDFWSFLAQKELLIKIILVVYASINIKLWFCVCIMWSIVCVLCPFWLFTFVQHKVLLIQFMPMSVSKLFIFTIHLIRLHLHDVYCSDPVLVAYKIRITCIWNIPQLESIYLFCVDLTPGATDHTMQTYGNVALHLRGTFWLQLTQLFLLISVCMEINDTSPNTS